MALILSVETATPVCSVALHSEGTLKASSHLHIEQSASSKLAVMIDELLKRCDLEPNQLSAVAVSSGPGSYTGLRIGVATAKGLCYALNIPLISVNTLMSMTRQMIDRVSEDTLLCPMLDARRMEVYCLVTNNRGEELIATEARVIDETSFGDLLQQHKILFFGSGALKCKDVIRHANAEFSLGIVPSAVDIGYQAFDKFQKSEFEDNFEFEPYYLKDFLIKKPKSLQ